MLAGRRGGKHDSLDCQEALVNPAEGNLQPSVDLFHAGFNPSHSVFDSIHIGAHRAQFAERVVDACVQARDLRRQQAGNDRPGAGHGSDDCLRIAIHAGSVAWRESASRGGERRCAYR